jgi:phosphomannomutase
MRDSSLAAKLRQAPVHLQFGTSGRRGLLVDLSQLEIYVNALAELEYLQFLPASEGGIRRGQELYVAHDLRPSSTTLLEGAPRRGELAQAVVRAVLDAGMVPVNLGAIPTPALTSYALARGKGSIMVTGSHIPFDRNGYKVNTAIGELLKHHEAPINRKVADVRARVYGKPFCDSLFDEEGMFKDGHIGLPAERQLGAHDYVRRYVDFFGAGALAGIRLLVYQHSAVGRDLIVEILRGLGAEVVVAGRSETFVPIDTENIGPEQLATIQALLDEAVSEYGNLDAVVSTDGDSDRPLILGVEAGPHPRARFFSGDLVGMVTAEFLGADAVLVPISCNDGIDRGSLKDLREPRTRIGSPYVIAGMQAAAARGRKAVCGWEANGGFLTGSDIVRYGRTLAALPTRDAVLPIVSVLCAARERKLSLIELFAQLPKRFSRAALLKQFPRAKGLEIVRKFSPGDDSVAQVDFWDAGVTVTGRGGTERVAGSEEIEQFQDIRAELSRFFKDTDGFDDIRALNFIDGVRILFGNGDVAHLRPSGNADELRIYAVADTQPRADAIADLGVREPDGILRAIERSLIT